MVDVVGEARAGGTAEVDAEVESLGGHGAAEEVDGPDGLELKVEELVVVQFFQLGQMGAGGDEEVAIGVREAVDEDERVRRGPEEQEVFPMGGVGRRGGAEEALAGGAFFQGADVFHPPGSVEGFGGHGRMVYAGGSLNKVAARKQGSA